MSLFHSFVKTNDVVKTQAPKSFRFKTKTETKTHDQELVVVPKQKLKQFLTATFDFISLKSSHFVSFCSVCVSSVILYQKLATQAK